MSWMSVAEAAIMAGKSKRTIYNLINERKIHTEDSTGGVMVELQEVRRVLDSRKPGRPRNPIRDTPAA